MILSHTMNAFASPPQKNDLDMTNPPAQTADPRFRPGQYSTMVILVPFGQMIEVDVDNFLRAMEAKGATVWREQGRFIDHLRSAMAYAAVKAGFEELLWVDADTRVDVAAVDMLREVNSFLFFSRQSANLGWIPGRVPLISAVLAFGVACFCPHSFCALLLCLPAVGSAHSRHSYRAEGTKEACQSIHGESSEA